MGIKCDILEAEGGLIMRQRRLVLKVTRSEVVADRRDGRVV